MPNNTSERAAQTQGVEQTDLATLVKHREWVAANTPLSDVYRWFENHGFDSCAVMDQDKVLGLCTRGHVGFLMGHRYGFAIHSRQPVHQHVSPNTTFIRRNDPLREVLESVVSRREENFGDDVILLGEKGEYLGIITMPALVKLQSALVTEKFRTQEALHNELLTVSRQAGMAEVATSVLHNVGNVLNSVKVASSIIGEKLRASKMGSVGRVSKLLEDHSGDLAHYLTHDEQGRKIPGFIRRLAEHLEKERTDLRKELDVLTQYIEHIEQVIFTQQTYARVSAVIQEVSPREVIEDALRINSEAYSRHGIKIRCEFDEIPNALLDKHKVLQILVNLLSNAKHACEDKVDSQKEIVVRLKRREPDRLRIEVSDNGVGISRENMSRIFTHGFTTRKTGHGFGLHNGALSAKQMGGSLSVASDGPGHGATFSLEIPFISADHKPKETALPVMRPELWTPKNSVLVSERRKVVDFVPT